MAPALRLTRAPRAAAPRPLCAHARPAPHAAPRASVLARASDDDSPVVVASTEDSGMADDAPLELEVDEVQTQRAMREERYQAEGRMRRGGDDRRGKQQEEWEDKIVQVGRLARGAPARPSCHHTVFPAARGPFDRHTALSVFFGVLVVCVEKVGV
jgi:hypothetical protein